MPRFSDEQITKWANDYEKLLCAKHDFIADRYSIPILSGVNEYEIPNYVSNIRAVLYTGKELHPKGFRASTLTGDTPFQTAGSVPFEYLFSGKGLRVLKLYPTPMENLAAYSGNLWTTAADRAACIVEFYRTPDQDDATLQLPDWFKRYVLKDYVCLKAYGSDGPQQDMRAAQYYEGRMSMQEMYLSTIRSNTHQAVQHTLMDSRNSARRMPGRPVLPPQFGQKVYW